MCFSATADFVGSTVLGGTGVATLREVKHRQELLLASVPLLLRYISSRNDLFGWD